MDAETKDSLEAVLTRLCERYAPQKRDDTYAFLVFLDNQLEIRVCDTRPLDVLVADILKAGKCSSLKEQAHQVAAQAFFRHGDEAVPGSADPPSPIYGELSDLVIFTGDPSGKGAGAMPALQICGLVKL